jgi:hypothetical protein
MDKEAAIQEASKLRSDLKSSQEEIKKKVNQLT